MAKSYKQIYEEMKPTEEELLALKAVVYGCNTNSMLRGGLHNGMRFEDAIVIVDKLIERLSV